MIFNLTNGVNVEPDLIEILGKAPVSLTITGDWANRQVDGVAVDTTGLTFIVTYNDSSTATITPTVSPAIWDGTGTKTATFTYEESGITLTTTKTATVVRVPISLAITGDWSNPQYKGKVVDTTGLTFTVTFASGKSETTTSIAVVPSTWSSDGTQTATFSYTESATTVSATKSVYVRNPLYIGTLVKSKASGSEKYITSVFYGQKASSLTSSSVVYEFYYTNDNGATFTRFYSVNAKDIVAGNGNTSGSTAMAINTAIQSEITAGRATSSSIIYYAVIDTENEYQSNSDAYASFYMYIPGNDDIKIAGIASGSSFSYATVKGSTSPYKSIIREKVDTAGTYPSGWNNSGDQAAHTETGRENWNTLKSWLEGSGSGQRANYIFDNVIVNSKKVISAWQIVVYVSSTTRIEHQDWFIPSIKELVWLRQTFGENKDYFGQALFGALYHNEGASTSNNGVLIFSSSQKGDANFFYYALQDDHDEVGTYRKRSENVTNQASVTLVRTF